VRVLVTGGTGFVGCHTVSALLKLGHEVCLLIRNPNRLERALAPLGIGAVDHVVGDVTDRNAVERAIVGCDAVFHAAAVFTLDQRREEEVMHVNVRGTELVFEAAMAGNLDPIIHVSSVSALYPPVGNMVGPDEEVKNPKNFYARSKALSERIARKFQAAGAPVVTVYPGSIWGPFDPTLSDGIEVILSYVKRGFIPVTPGGIPMVDVRDLAAVHAAAMRAGRGPRRYMAGGHFINNAELIDILNSITGENLRKLFVPGSLIRGIGRFGDIARRVTGIDIGLTYEAMVTLTRGVPCDDSRIREELGVHPRSTAETLRDTLRWMLAEGILEPRHVGHLAD